MSSVNFRIIENSEPSWYKFRDELKHDYLNTSIGTDDLIRKYGMNKTSFYKATKEIREEEGITRRPHVVKNNRRMQQYIMLRDNGKFMINKCIGGRTKYLGTYDTFSEAVLARSICMCFDWDVSIDEIKRFMREVRLWTGISSIV